MTPRIAPVTPETLPHLEQGLRALAADLGDPYHMEAAALEAALFSATPACHGLLALQEDAPRGIAVFSPFLSTVRGAAGVFVSDLWIAPAARRSGLGPRLLAATARRAQMLWQATHLRLMSYDDNPRANAFYTHLGFEAQTGEAVFRLWGDGFRKLARME